MKVLLDENLPHALRHELPGHDVYTVQYMGWSGTKNGALLAKAAAQGFSAIVTMDNGMQHQQNVSHIALSLLVISAPSNDMDDLRPLLSGSNHSCSPWHRH
jgi:predicted nuclease of predicted toxin-antitoxin system